MLWSDWLAIYKESCGTDCVLRLSRTPALQNICIAWRNCLVEFPLLEPVPSDAKIDKILAWKYVSYDVHELADKSGHPPAHCIIYMQQSISMDMIYPDGTLNRAAEKLMSAIIAKSIKEAAK